MNILNIMTSFRVTAFLLLASLFSVQTTTAQDIEQVSPIKAKLMARNGGLMIDVREKDEVAVLAYDVENLVNIPLSEIQSRLSEIPKDKKLVIACRSGNRSMKAAQILVDNGFTNLVNMEGGMLAWQEKNLEVVADGKTTKKACCANPNSKDCNPDGTCKPGAKKEKKCCSSGDKKKCGKDDK